MTANQTNSNVYLNTNGVNKTLPSAVGSTPAVEKSPVISFGENETLQFSPIIQQLDTSGRFDIPVNLQSGFWTSGNIIYFGGGNEAGTGTENSDIIYAGNGNDVIVAGNGSDKLYGNAGDDTFVFGKAFAKTTVMDFTINDQIVLDDAYFASLANGITSDNVRIVSGAANAKAVDANDYLIYDRQSGNLFYDADGSGVQAAELVGVIKGSINNISYADFVVG